MSIYYMLYFLKCVFSFVIQDIVFCFAKTSFTAFIFKLVKGELKQIGQF